MRGKSHDASDQSSVFGDVTEWLDTDGDNTGNNADTDDDGDGTNDTDDAFPFVGDLVFHPAPPFLRISLFHVL